jgi:phosphinothricin acetyltransferase
MVVRAMVIRAMTAGDWPCVRAIYEAGIATGNATFETAAPDWSRWDAGHLPDHRLVAVEERKSGPAVAGWAALAPVSDRCAYSGVAENSVYVDPARQGRGIGRQLLRALVDQAEAAGIWTVQTGIFPENAASLALHAACGFRVVGRRERIGRLHGVWRDVLFLEHRSPSIN